MKSKQRNARVRLPFPKIFLSLSKIIETSGPARKHTRQVGTWARKYASHVGRWAHKARSLAHSY